MSCAAMRADSSAESTFVYSIAVKAAQLGLAVYVERVVEGRDDAGREERIVIWIERRPGAVWAVGRTVNRSSRAAPEPHEEDYSAGLRARRRARGRERDARGRLRRLRGRRPRRQASGRSAARSCSRPLERFFFGHAATVARPVEVGVRDRIAVRIVGREAERAVDPRLELLRDHVLEPVGLVVHVVDVRGRASARGRARADGGGGSPRPRPARRPRSAARRGTARGRAGRARRASSPSPTPMRPRRSGRARPP